MPFNLLLLPLLGGYIFALRFNPTRFYLLRAEKERLLFMAAFCGFWLTAAGWIINALAASYWPCEPDKLCIPTWWNRHVGIDYLGISVASLILGIILPPLLNKLRWFKDVGAQIDKVIEKDADPFEILLRRSEKQSATVAVTMKNGKVYIGWVNHQFNPGVETSFISLFPVQSGYRDAVTKRLVRTVDYTKTQDNLKTKRGAIAKKLTEASSENLESQKNLLVEYEELEYASKSFSIVLPVSEIASITLYSSKIHDEYFDSEPLLPPEQVTAKAISPTEIELSWKPPKAS